MSIANRSTLACAAIAVIAMSLASGCSGVATREIEAQRVALPHDSIKLDAKGLPDARIDPAGAVKIGSRPLPLTEAQRGLTAQYRNAVIELTDYALRDTTRLTRHVVARVLFGMVTGRLEKTTDKIEQQAEAIMHSAPFCSRLEVVKQRQDVMTGAVSFLLPYANLTYQQLEDCVSGQPYSLGVQTEGSDLSMVTSKTAHDTDPHTDD